MLNYIQITDTRIDQLEIEAIIATHGHIDHIDGVNRVKEKFKVPFYANELDRELIETVQMQARMFGVPDRSRRRAVFPAPRPPAIPHPRRGFWACPGPRPARRNNPAASRPQRFPRPKNGAGRRRANRYARPVPSARR